MTKNLEKADTIVKLTLALSVIVFYSLDIINGPFARVLTALSGLTVVIFIVKHLYNRKPDKKG